MKTIAILFAILLSCTTSSLRSHGDKISSDTNFQRVLYNPQAYMGDMVVWGGEIVEVISSDSGSEITLIQIPLDKRGKPGEKKYSVGRFLVKTEMKLDKEIFTVRRTIVVHGKIGGSLARSLGKSTYAYPVILADEIHYWQQALSGELKHCWQAMGWDGPYDWKCE